MTPRRVWSIAVRFARQTDGDVRFSAIHWSPPSQEWPEAVRAAALDLRDAMKAAVATPSQGADK